MANLQHRTAQDRRYDLRGNAPIIVLSQTAAQQRKDAAARRVKHSWPITRLSRRSRGLRKKNNSCFRLSGLQALLHLPKFLHWISSHNSRQRNGTIKFPCRDLDDVCRALVTRFSAGNDEERPLKLGLQRCPACTVKQFCQAYWGSNTVTALGVPLPWSHDHPEMTAMRNLDMQLYPLTAGAADGSQQDPGEMQDRLLNACLTSTDHTLPENADWLDQFNALFIIEYDVDWHCACGAAQPVPFATIPEWIGIDNLAILPERTTDSVANALAREFTPEVLGNFNCAACGLQRPRTQTKRIDGTPDLLRIKISNIYSTGDRNNNPITLDPEIDLKPYHAGQHLRPLKYRLKSVLPHDGGMGGGHWTATVCDPQQVNFINDHNVAGKTRAFLASNPQHRMQAIYLNYVRVQNRSK